MLQESSSLEYISITDQVSQRLDKEASLADIYVSSSAASTMLGSGLFPESLIIELIKSGLLQGSNILTDRWLVDKNSIHQYSKTLRSSRYQAVINSDIIEPICTPSLSAIPEVDEKLSINQNLIIASESGSTLGEKISTDSVRKSKDGLINGISIDALSEQDIEKFVVTAKRKILVFDVGMPSVKLEISMSHTVLSVNGKINGKNQRCILSKLTFENVTKENIMMLLTEYNGVMKELGRKPYTHEFKLYSCRIKTLGDALNAHLRFNIAENHGDGSDEDKLFRALISNHLSKSIDVTFPNQSSENMILIEENLKQLTPARYKAYMATFKGSPGTHDKILTRISAAMNFCFERSLLNRGDFNEFHNTVNKISSQRHVAVSNKDLRLIGSYLERENFNNERCFREFKLFMRLEMTGSFRTKTTVDLKYEQFDFQNQLIKILAKGGKPITICTTEHMCKQVKDHFEWQKSQGIDSPYLFPSPQNQKKSRANFDNEWNKLRKKHGFYEVVGSNIKYKYHLHDFRETLLTRMSDCDDVTLSALLGHTTQKSLKHYREANRRNVAMAAQNSESRLTEILD